VEKTGDEVDVMEVMVMKTVGKAGIDMNGGDENFAGMDETSDDEDVRVMIVTVMMILMLALMGLVMTKLLLS
jgi:hypothetical protein